MGQQRKGVGGSLPWCCPVSSQRLRDTAAAAVPCACLLLLLYTGYAVDITIPSLMVAVEADGPSHFSRTLSHPAAPGGRLLQLGATAMKARHLSALGWAVVNVPYSDWDRQTDEQQRVAYLKARIAEARKRQQDSR